MEYAGHKGEAACVREAETVVARGAGFTQASDENVADVIDEAAPGASGRAIKCAQEDACDLARVEGDHSAVAADDLLVVVAVECRSQLAGSNLHDAFVAREHAIELCQSLPLDGEPFRVERKYPGDQPVTIGSRLQLEHTQQETLDVLDCLVERSDGELPRMLDLEPRKVDLVIPVKHGSPGWVSVGYGKCSTFPIFRKFSHFSQLYGRLRPGAWVVVRDGDLSREFTARLPGGLF